MKVKFYYSSGDVKKEVTQSFSDECSDEEIEEDFHDWLVGHTNAGYVIVEEEATVNKFDNREFK